MEVGGCGRSFPGEDGLLLGVEPDKEIATNMLVAVSNPSYTATAATTAITGSGGGAAKLILTR